jgi:hypothetical protein
VVVCVWGVCGVCVGGCGMVYVCVCGVVCVCVCVCIIQPVKGKKFQHMLRG